MLAGCVVGLFLVLLVVAGEAHAWHTKMLNAGDVQTGLDWSIHALGHADGPASLGTGTTRVLLRYSPAGSPASSYEGVARDIDHNYQDAWLSWGAGSNAGGPAGTDYDGGCTQTPMMGGIPCTSTGSSNAGITAFTPAGPTPIATCASHLTAIGAGGGTLPPGESGRPMYVTHEWCPLAANIYRNNITILNRYVDKDLDDVRYRRAMEWNAETLPSNMGAAQYVTVSGTTPLPPNLAAFGDNGRMSHNVWDPITAPACAAAGAYFQNCTAGKGFVFDFRFGTLGPGEEIRFCMIYGGAPDYDEAWEALLDFNVEFFSTAYRGSDSPVTFFVGVGCLSPPIVDFTWAAEPHIHAPPGWTPLTACVGSKVTFSDLSYVNGLVKGDPAKSAWSFGDGNGTSTSWSDTVEHTYMSAGTYDVSLTVWSMDDRNVTVTKPIEVIDCPPPPPVNEAPVLMPLPCKTVTEGSLVSFRLVAYDPDAPPDPSAFYTLAFTLEGAPPGAQVIGDLFRWEASALGEHRFTVRVQDNGAPPLSDETEACITVYPQPPAPESSDADGDGVPDSHDPCPATAGASGCPRADEEEEARVPAGGGGDDGPPGLCHVEELLPVDVEGRLDGREVTIAWKPPACAVDRFLVWNGTQGDLIAEVPFDPDLAVYEVRDTDPWMAPHRYYVQAEPARGDNVFVYPRAVPTGILALQDCTDCDGAAPEARRGDFPPIDGIASVFVGGASHLLLPWLPVVLLLLAAWWFWHSYGTLVRVFSRLDEKKVLDHPTRARIHEIVAAEPGIHGREIARRAGLSRGVVRHHLKMLAAATVIEQRTEGGYTRYFVARTAPDEKRTAGTLRSDLAQGILARIRERPGMNVSELAHSLDVTHKAVRYHLRRFERAGLVDLEKTGAGILVRPAGGPSTGAAS